MAELSGAVYITSQENILIRKGKWVDYWDRCQKKEIGQLQVSPLSGADAIL